MYSHPLAGWSGGGQPVVSHGWVPILMGQMHWQAHHSAGLRGYEQGGGDRQEQKRQSGEACQGNLTLFHTDRGGGVWIVKLEVSE